MERTSIDCCAGINSKSALRNLKSAILMGALLSALCATAAVQQTRKIPRIGYLTLVAKPNAREEAFVQGLRELGWVDGQNIAIEYRRADKPETLAALADELVALKVDILAAAATPAVQAAKNATKTIPIVMVTSADAVRSGFVASLAQPGGNITGNTNIFPELAGKRLELLKEILPKLSRVAFLAYGPDPAHKLFIKDAQDAAQSFKIRFQPLVLKSVDEIDRAFHSMVKERAGAVIIQTLFTGVLGQSLAIAELGIKNRLPTISDAIQFAEQGGLTFYGPEPIEGYRRAATFVDKILKGRKPADLPVEQPTKFELVINLRTAKRIGLTIPPNVLARADRVIK